MPVRLPISKEQRMKYLLLALCESCPNLKNTVFFSCARKCWEVTDQTLTVEKLGQTSCPMLYTQPLDKIEEAITMRSALNKTFFFDGKRRKKDVAKAPQIYPFGYAEPLPRNLLNRLKYRGSFHAFLGVVSPFRAALRSPFSALSSFADSQNVHLSGRHQTVLSFGLTRCLAAVAS